MKKIFLICLIGTFSGMAMAQVAPALCQRVTIDQQAINNLNQQIQQIQNQELADNATCQGAINEDSKVYNNAASNSANASI
jgi:hypothetical protein